MAKKLKTTQPLVLPTFHRKAAFQLLPRQDYDDVQPGDLFTAWVGNDTAVQLADPALLTRTKRLQIKLSAKEYRPYCHPETVDSRSLKVKQLCSEIETRGVDRYEVRYVHPVELVSPVAETLPEWAVTYLENAAQGYGSDDTFERLMWEICITPDQEQWLNQHRLTLQHLSEGRTPGALCATVYTFFADWNQKLGEPFWHL